MSNFIQKYVKCPFFLSSDRNKIRCEGFYEGCSVQILFTAPTLASQYLRSYCCAIGGFEQCPIYQLADSKYTKKGDQKK